MMLSTDQIINMISGVAAVVTAIATFVTILQIYKQRKESYKPNLVPVRQYADCSVPEDIKTLRYKWSKKSTDKPGKLVAEEPHERYTIPVFNVGCGPAINIKTEWKIPYDELIKRINLLAKQTPVSFGADYNQSEKTIILSANDGPQYIHMVGNQSKYEEEYLLPASLDNEGFQVTFPPALITVISMMIVFGPLIENVPKKINELLESIATLQLSYFDIVGNVYKKSFRLGVEIQWVKSSQTHKEKNITAIESFKVLIKFENDARDRA